MALLIDRKEILQALRDINRITGTKAALFDQYLEEICSYPETHCAFCQHLRQNKHGEAGCRGCDKNAQKSAARAGGESIVYTCHAGLTEVITPIYSGSKPIGYLMIGQCARVGGGGDALWESIAKRNEGYADVRELRPLFERVCRITDEQIGTFARVIKAYASHIEAKKLLRARSNPDFNRIEEYIGDSLAQEITAAVLCAELLIPRNALFRIVREETGLSLGNYIQKKRLDYAKELLLGENHTIARISELCGISDYNYFSRVFKEKFGLSPGRYRVLGGEQ